MDRQLYRDELSQDQQLIMGFSLTTSVTISMKHKPPIIAVAGMFDSVRWQKEMLPRKR